MLAISTSMETLESIIITNITLMIPKIVNNPEITNIQKRATVLIKAASLKTITDFPLLLHVFIVIRKVINNGTVQKRIKTRWRI